MDLLSPIWKAARYAADSGEAAKALDIIREGSTSYADAQDYAYHVGKALSDAFTGNLSSAVLPGGKMTEELAEEIVRTLLEEGHGMVSDAAVIVQNALNSSAGIGLKAQRAALNESRINGIISRLVGAENFDDIAWILGDPVVNFSMAVADETLRRNVEFQGKAGLKPVLIRKAPRKCCEWCNNLAGVYEYPDVPDDVYRRHENCRCTVEYDPGTGRKQNVHTKQWR